MWFRAIIYQQCLCLILRLSCVRVLILRPASSMCVCLQRPGNQSITGWGVCSRRLYQVFQAVYLSWFDTDHLISFTALPKCHPCCNFENDAVRMSLWYKNNCFWFAVGWCFSTFQRECVKAQWIWVRMVSGTSLRCRTSQIGSNASVSAAVCHITILTVTWHFEFL
jgi:hypothetical protein